MRETSLKEVIIAYRNLSFSDRTAFYYTVSNDVDVHENNLQDFLIRTRMKKGGSCIYCEGEHVVKNGKRKDGTQRYICRDCGRSFIPATHSIMSGTRKKMAVWTAYLRCMMDRKTLKDTSEVCGISVTTAFAWRHKILGALHELTGKVYLAGTVEADETFFNVSYKGNHKNSRQFTMPREAHKRGSDVHTSGLSSEKVCVPCMITTYRGKTYGIQRINAYHRTLKDFMRGFHGVSTKHLGSYIVWNDLMRNHRRGREDTLRQLLGQLLNVRMTIRNSSISARAPLPCH